ncbi:hypothetical protein [Botrimarina hoheduenensis]|uniref:GGDEF domain-containing protein n=1 Tax=Botrimarina hoheduenensis TaxID=2528000 RepID=A0A5C5WB13_9BACT|nr:hypothetical protein [Botrimarina hoheduenensis]TWT47269.1 hypothetical protein Pla111_08820 [Botrimarina hoheduenensis]
MLPLLIIGLIATTNLAVGYALGASRAFGPLLSFAPKISKRRSDPRAEDEVSEDNDEELLSAPQPVAESTPAIEPQSLAASAPKAEKSKLSTPEVMTGIAAFRDKLSAASVELKLSRDDPNRFDNCANKLQEVNHDYLEQVDAAVDRLDELSEEGDASASAAREVVSGGIGEAKRISGQIDQIIDKGMDETTRAELIEKSISMRNVAIENSSSAEAAVEKVDEQIAAGEAMAKSALAAAEDNANELLTGSTAKNAEDGIQEPADASAASPLASIDEVFDKLETLLTSAEGEADVLVAEVRADKLDLTGIEDPAAAEAAILKTLATTATELLGESRAQCVGDRCIVLLNGDTFEQAAKRMEQLRQQMQAIEYQVGSQKLKATVTCGLIETHAGDDRPTVESRLETALNESLRLGTNRTFHHDGAFPTPLPELKVETSPRTVQV